MKLREIQFYVKADQGYRSTEAWKGRNSEVIAYYEGEYEAYVISKGKKGKIYKIVGIKAWEQRIQFKNPTNPFPNWHVYVDYKNELKDIARYIKKAVKLGMNANFPRKAEDMVRQYYIEKEI